MIYTNPSNFIAEHFPWIMQFNNPWIAILGFYTLFSNLIAMDNARKARAYDEKVSLKKLENANYNILYFGSVGIILIISIILSIEYTIPWIDKVIAVSLSTILCALGLLPLLRNKTMQSLRVNLHILIRKFSPRLSRKVYKSLTKQTCLAASLILFAILDFAFYINVKNISYTTLLISVIPIITIAVFAYILRDSIDKIIKYFRKKYEWFLIFGSIYSVIILCSMMFAIAIFLQNNI